MRIKLEFRGLTLDAELFKTKTAAAVGKALPLKIALQTWGNECYGTTGLDLPPEHPVRVIPPGGLAYSTQGGFFCVFYGQKPAWPVEHIGQIKDDSWIELEGIDWEKVVIKKS